MVLLRVGPEGSPTSTSTPKKDDALVEKERPCAAPTSTCIDGASPDETARRRLRHSNHVIDNRAGHKRDW